MPYTPHVNGPALIRLGRQGDGAAHSDALQDLGFTEGGPNIRIEFYKEDIIADLAGPYLPVDIQKMGKRAKINFQAAVYDRTVLHAFLLDDNIGLGGGVAEGQQPMTGELIFANDRGFRLILTSPIDGMVWRFLYCSVDDCDQKPGSKYNIWNIAIDAIAFPGTTNGSNWATTLQGKALWDHTNG